MKTSNNINILENIPMANTSKYAYGNPGNNVGTQFINENANSGTARNAPVAGIIVATKTRTNKAISRSP